MTKEQWWGITDDLQRGGGRNPCANLEGKMTVKSEPAKLGYQQGVARGGVRSITLLWSMFIMCGVTMLCAGKLCI
jgi:hypothetical protein